MLVYQVGSLFSAADNTFLGPVGPILAAFVLAGLVYMLVRPYKEAQKLEKEVKIK